MMVKKLWVIVLSAFFIPLFFNPGNEVFIETNFFLLHKEAIVMGFIFSSRIVLLALLTSILAQTTKTDEFASGIETLIRPLDKIGMDSKVMADLIYMSLSRLPQSWQEIQSVLVYLLKGKRKDFAQLRQVVVQAFVFIFSARSNKN